MLGERIAAARYNVGVPEERGDEKRRPGIVRLRYYIQGYSRRVVNSPLLLVPFFRSRASTLFRLAFAIRDDISQRLDNTRLTASPSRVASEINKDHWH